MMMHDVIFTQGYFQLKRSEGTCHIHPIRTGVVPLNILLPNMVVKLWVVTYDVLIILICRQVAYIYFDDFDVKHNLFEGKDD